jgi:POT family proton-dependent oligopeptide transporter
MGTARATAINMTFQFLSFTIPVSRPRARLRPLSSSQLLSGYFSDTRWGRYKTITYGLMIGAVSHALLIIPAIPQVLEKVDAARALFIISVLLLAFATGFIKPSLNPLLCDQNPIKRQYVKRLPSGELVIVDPTTTLQGYQLMFYQCISYGSVFGLATTYSARRVGFWLAFGLPGILYVVMCFLLRFLGPRLVKVPPKAGVVGELFAVFKRVLSNGGLRELFSRKAEDVDEFWNKAKPSVIASRGHDVSRVTWDDQL